MKVIILGGGASGLMAALSAARDARNTVTILERQSRVGRKLLATGNGRCNLTNLQLSPARYHGQDPAFAQAALTRFGVQDTLEFFRGLGLPTVAEDSGRVYPLSDQANSVLDVLRFAAEQAGVQTICGFDAQSVRKKARGYQLTAADGTGFFADRLIIACGGCAGKALGGTMAGYDLLGQLGHSRTPLHFLIAAAVVNVILDILFMKYLHFGVEGAAWATVLSQLASGIACLVYMAKKIPVLNLHHDDMKPDWKRICYMAAIGVPMGLQFAITAVGSIILQGAVNGLGAQAVAAVSAASKVHNVVAAPLETCGIAMATYCGQNLGAGQYARIRRGIWSTTAAAMIYCALAFVFNYSAGRGMATLFVSPSEVMILQDVQKYLVIQSVFYPMLAVIFIFRNGLQGMGYSNQAMMAGVSELIARALVSFGLVGSLGFTAVCYANPAAWLFADGVLLVLYVRVMRRLDPIRPQDLKARKLAKAQR